jgi:hypothetical protein
MRALIRIQYPLREHGIDRHHGGIYVYLDIREEDVSTASLTTRRLEQNRVEALGNRVGISRMRRKSRIEKRK